jgi:hypothetical protein
MVAFPQQNRSRLASDERRMRDARTLEELDASEVERRLRAFQEQEAAIERDRLHTQWREDNEGLVLTPGQPAESNSTAFSPRL